MSKTLEALFQSKARIKLLKFFFRNSGEGYQAREIAKRVRESSNTVRKEIKNFLKIDLVLKK